MGKKLRVTQVKSLISEKPKIRSTVRSLGLKKIGDSVVREDTAANRGYIRACAHLVRVEEIK